MNFKGIKSLFVMAIAASTIMVACKKEETDKQVAAPNQADKQTESRIKAFDAKISNFASNKGAKGSETMPVDSAIWLMEASFNYNYARNSVALYAGDDDVVKYSIAIEGNEVNFENVYNVYSQYVNHLQESLIGTGKKIAVIDVNNKIEATSKGKQIEIVAVIGEEKPEDFKLTSSDYWYWGFKKGKCGDYSGYSGQKDATDRLEQLWKGNAVSIIDGYYTDINEVDIVPNYVMNQENFPFEPGTIPYNVLRSFIFQAEVTSSCDPCLTPDMINYYYNSIKVVINLQKPYNKQYIRLADIYPDIMPTGHPTYPKLHRYKVNYGVFHHGANPM